jgi:hypothetical protein
MSIKDIQDRAAVLARAGKPAVAESATADRTKVGKPPEPVPIPFPVTWAEEQFAAPNISLRSALFGVSKRGRRRVIRERIAAQDGYEIIYAGETLDQADEDVWLVVLHHARRDGMGVDVHFTLRGLCKALQWPSDGRSVDRLRRILHRLTEGTVELRSGRFSFTGHLVDFIARDDETGRFYLQLSPKMAKLFDADSYTYLHAHRRLSLHSYLAKWLDGYLASHTKPHPVKVETIKAMCGSQMSDTKHFRAELRAALNDLKREGAIREWKIDARDLVRVERNVLGKQSLQSPKRSLTDGAGFGAGAA